MANSPATRDTPAPGSAPESLGQRQVLVVFSGLMLAMLLAALDQTIAAAELPRLPGCHSQRAAKER